MIYNFPISIPVCSFRRFLITILHIQRNMGNKDPEEDLTQISEIMEEEEVDMAIDDRVIKAINPN